MATTYLTEHGRGMLHEFRVCGGVFTSNVLSLTLSSLEPLPECLDSFRNVSRNPAVSLTPFITLCRKYS